MRWGTIVPAAVVVCLVLAGCGQQEGKDAPGASAPPVANAVPTAEIQAGIERHIEAQVRLGGGYFKLPFRNQELRLKLVRVHTEYLSKLGPGRYFACVDLADISGDVYDVDFFMAGDPAAMKVTETTVHKINGQPFYAWEQRSDGAWQRIPLKEASEGHLGVIRDRDEFEFVYRATLPKITDTARMWLPLAVTDSFQTVEIKSINAPGKQSILPRARTRQQSSSLRAWSGGQRQKPRDPLPGKAPGEGCLRGADARAGKYLNPELLVPGNENFRQIAEEVVKGKRGDLVRARALYDHVIDRMRYIKYGDGWGKGDAVYRLQRPHRQLHGFPLLLHCPGQVGGHPGALRHRRGHPFGAERGRGGRLSLLGGVLCRGQVVAD